MPRASARPDNRSLSATGHYQCEWCGQRFDWANMGKNNPGKVPHYCSDDCQVMELVECAACGEVVAKRKSRGASRRPTCSLMCRYFVTNGHWQSSVWPKPEPRPKPKPVSRFIAAYCPECGTGYVTTRTRAGTARGFCSMTCNRRQKSRRRRAREHNASGMFTWLDVIKLWMANDKRCAYCDKQMTEQPEPDHVTPLSRGGQNYLSNILPSCRRCNGDKSDLTIDEWEQDRTRRNLPPLAFDPNRFKHLSIRPAVGSPSAVTRAWRGGGGGVEAQTA